MDSLQIDAELLRKAELQAQLHNINLNKVVEAFIHKFINQPEKTTIKVTPFIARLGTSLQLPADFDEKDAYRKHLEEKYR